MANTEEEKQHCLDYIRNHPTMGQRTKVILAEVVKADLTTNEIVELMPILARSK